MKFLRMQYRSLSILLFFCFAVSGFAEGNPGCDSKNVCAWIQSDEKESALFLQAKSLPAGTHMTVFTTIEGKDIETDPPTPLSISLEGDEIKKGLVLKKKDNANQSSFSTILTVAYFGKLGAVHNDSYAYSLPYEGKSWISTGYNSGNEHKGDAAYSIDFVLPEGTPLLAARSGIVVETEDKYTLGKKDPKLIDKANHIIIEHEDGTVAIYGHLRPAGVIVKVGDKVTAGQRIGFSGNTGYTTGPHLHFEVYRPEENRKKTTFPTLFLTEIGEKEFLNEENAYWNPDGKKFPGFPITNLDSVCIGENVSDEGKVSPCSGKVGLKKSFFLGMPIYKSGPYTFQAHFSGPTGKKTKIEFTLKYKIPTAITDFAFEIPPQKLPGKYKVKFQLEEKEIGEREFQILP